MNSDNSAIDRFVQAWVAEFTRAVEMFSGEAPEIRCTRRNTVSDPPSEPNLWVQQLFVEGGAFQSWVGAQGKTWQTLGGSLGEGSAEALRSTYLEIVNQAQQGSATAINSGFGRNIRCEPSETFTAATFEPSDVVAYDIEFGSGTLPPMFLAVQHLATNVLEPKTEGTGDESTGSASLEDCFSPISASLLALKLPIAVSIANTELTLKAALAARPGSVIRLNKDVSEPVELLVHGRVVARGELVLVKGSYGLRVTHIVSRESRLSVCFN